MTLQDDTAGNILDYLSDLKNCPDKALAPYEEFEVGGKSYYFTPGGSLYRKDGEAEEEMGRRVFCGYPSSELWGYRTDDG